MRWTMTRRSIASGYKVSCDNLLRGRNADPQNLHACTLRYIWKLADLAGGVPTDRVRNPGLPRARLPARTSFATCLGELTKHACLGYAPHACLSARWFVNRAQPRLYLAQDRYDEPRARLGARAWRHRRSPLGWKSVRFSTFLSPRSAPCS